MPRPLRPRATSALVVAPVAITDLTAPAVLGIEARPFREWLVTANVPHTRRGKRVIALVADVVAALERSAASSPDEDGQREQQREAPRNVDSLRAHRPQEDRMKRPIVIDVSRPVRCTRCVRKVQRCRRCRAVRVVRASRDA